VRDRLIGRALSEGYRSILPHGVYPVALLFIEVPLEEVDVNVHPAKTEVRFRRAAAVADAVREAVRAALASAGYAPSSELKEALTTTEVVTELSTPAPVFPDAAASLAAPATQPSDPSRAFILAPQPQQERISFGFTPSPEDGSSPQRVTAATATAPAPSASVAQAPEPREAEADSREIVVDAPALPPLDSALKFVREVAVESVSSNIRPLGQLDESFIIATDDEGLLLIDQHVAHERVLFDKYRGLESSRRAESQVMLIPETFDLTPAQAAAFDVVESELESYGFELMRLSGRTVAIKAAPADLPASEARNMLAEVLDTVDAEKRGAAKATLRDEIAASLACHAAIKVNMRLTPEKMRWLVDRLLMTSSPTTCPHGRPVILRLATQDILKGFHRI